MKGGAAEQECAVEGLIAAEQRIQVGDMVTTSADLLDCGTSSESVTDDGNAKQTVSQWQTSIATGSLYTSENRQPSVFLRDSPVAFVQFLRFSSLDSFLFAAVAFCFFYNT